MCVFARMHACVFECVCSEREVGGDGPTRSHKKTDRERGAQKELVCVLRCDCPALLD